MRRCPHEKMSGLKRKSADGELLRADTIAERAFCKGERLGRKILRCKKVLARVKKRSEKRREDAPISSGGSAKSERALIAATRK